MDKRFIIDTNENREYMKTLREELINFGKRFPSEGGGAYYLGDDGTPWTDRPRETWITCRMAHVYSIGALLGYEWCRKTAAEAFRGLKGELKDRKSGGWFSGVTADGACMPDKMCYAHAFVILAGTSGVLAGVEGAGEILEEALKIYDEKFWDESQGLAVDTWNTEFEKLDSYRGLNANMHTVEAFLAVADATGDEKYRERAGRIINRVIGWAQDNSWRIPEHFTREWKADTECNKDNPADRFKPYGATPGHGIEWSRLICQWAAATYPSSEADRYFDIAQKLYDRAIEDAWNADGAPGIVYTTDWEGRPVVHDRMHWTLAEAINSSAVLYRITENEKYAQQYSEFLQYLEEKVHDRVNGSWFHQLNSVNEVIGTVWPGKSDLYHAFQATLIPYSPVDTSVAAAVNKKYDVVALGELLIDFTLSGKSDRGNSLFEANPGGAPCNALSMLCKLNKRTAFIGKVSNDMFGRQLRDTIEQVGIDGRYLLADTDIPTTLAFVHNLPDGDREFSFYRKPGADMMLKEQEIRQDMLANTRIFHFGTLSMTDEGVRRATLKAIELAKNNGAIISLDPNLREPLWENLEDAREQMMSAVSYCDILKISDNEITFLTGEEDYDKGVERLQQMYGTKLICLTMGSEGSRAYYKDMRAEVPAFKQEQVVDTTGAGDTFCGCVLSYICEHGLDALSQNDLIQMLTFANAAAGLVTTKPGAIKSMPDREDVERIAGERSY